MANDLPKIGVSATVENADRYFSILEQIEKSTSKTAQALEKQAAKTQAVSKAATDSVSKMNPLSKMLDKLDTQFGGVGKQISGFADELGISVGALGAVTVGIGVAVAAFVMLGQRGATLVGLQESFERLNSVIGVDAVASLQRLRTASGGTIADFELMRLTNVALAGATGKFGQQFGEELPRLLEIARVQARATGQDVGFLFQSLITGIKRGSPMLIDNTGLVLKVSEANATMAASLGKSVEQLTAEEKQMAILNATLAAGQTAINGFVGVQETAADKMARMNATISNILDTLAVAVQPAFSAILDGVNAVLGVIERFVRFMAPATTLIWNFLTAFVSDGLQTFARNLNTVGDALAPVFTFMSQIFELAGAAFSKIVAPISQAFNAIGKTIGDAVKKIFIFLTGWNEKDLGLELDKLPQRLAYGAGAAFAAFGNAIIAVANKLIFPAVNLVAQYIADFLVGQSPPPKGPLSQIDKGGANTMLAWMEGFAGVSLAPVEQVAAQVDATLGAIGSFSTAQVEARLAQLDTALQPFNDQLAIVKSNFEAIAAPANAALSAIDRQMNKALVALSAGEAGSAEAVRALDAQRAKIEDALDMQQGLVDQAQIQQALAAAQQGQERTLLSIQQARLKAAEQGIDLTKEGTKAAKDAASAEKAAKGGAGAGLGDAGIGDLSLPTTTETAPTDNPLAGAFNAGFDQNIDTAGLKQMQNSAVTLQKNLTKIGQADIGTRIADAFTNVGTAIGVKLQEASIVINDWIGGITDPAREGSIPFALNALASGDYTALVTGLNAPFQQLSADFEQWIYDNFDIANLTSILGTLSLLPTRIGNALAELPDAFNEAVLVPIQDTVTNVGLAIGHFFVDTGEGTLSGMIDSGVAWFTALPGRIFTALAGVGAVFFAAVATPIVAGVNVVIEAIEGMINYALSALGTLIGSVAGIAEAVGLGDQVAAIQADLVGGINLPRLSLPTPPAAVMPAARAGGIFSGGLIKTHKDEIMGNAASKTAIFPASVSRNLEILAGVLGGGGGYDLPQAYAGGGNYGNNSTYNQNFNMGTPPSTGNAVQEIATLMSMRRGRS